MAALPGDLRAALVVVAHIGASRSLLPELLDNIGPLPARFAAHGAPIRPGHVYVAPPDRHVLVRAGRLVLARGPFENGARPAIDPTFRSAAISHGPRAVGIVLSGADSDGAAGLEAIKRCGGVTVAQDPREAPFPEMPRAAMNGVAIDHVVPVAAMAALITRLAATPAKRAVPVPADLRREVEIAMRLGQGGDMRAPETGQFTCPDCGGRLAQVGQAQRFRCEVGHAYSAQGLIQAQSTAIEDALYVALRTNLERAALLRRMAEATETRHQRGAAKALLARAAEYTRYAETIRKALAQIDAAPMTTP